MATTNTTSYVLRFNSGNTSNSTALLPFNYKTTLLHSSHKPPPSKKPSSTLLLPTLLSHSFSSQQPPPSSPRFRVPRVSTAPLDFAPPAPDSSSFHQEISRLSSLRINLARSKTLNDKHAALNADSRVKSFFSNGFARILASHIFDSKELVLLKCLVAAGQQHVLNVEGVEFVERDEVGDARRSSLKSAFYALAGMIERYNLSGNGKVGLRTEEVENLKKLLTTLAEIEQFYDCIGGIIGYQIMALELLARSTPEKQSARCSQSIQEIMKCQFCKIHAPSGLDLSKNTEYASQAALWGIET